MDEGDLRVPSRAADRRAASRSWTCFSSPAQRPDVDARFASLLDSRPDVVLFDVLDDARLAEVGGCCGVRGRRS
jgi:hypothetical protein